MFRPNWRNKSFRGFWSYKPNLLRMLYLNSIKFFWSFGRSHDYLKLRYSISILISLHLSFWQEIDSHHFQSYVVQVECIHWNVSIKDHWINSVVDYRSLCCVWLLQQAICDTFSINMYDTTWSIWKNVSKYEVVVWPPLHS